MQMFYVVLISILIALLSGCCAPLKDSNQPVTDTVTWINGYCNQVTTTTPAADADSIKAYVNKTWKDYKLNNLPAQFMAWAKANRSEYIDIFEAMLTDSTATKRPRLAGSHNAMVATYGYKRDDSNFKLNNAVKGVGFVPKAGNIDSVIANLTKTMNSPLSAKLQVLRQMYQSADSLYDTRMLGSLELYSNPEFMTQTFLNQMVNPACAMVFLDMPTFKVKAIARVLHPDNPKLSDLEKKQIRYLNLIHDYFHGKSARKYMAVVYYVSEVYDSSPAGFAPGKGKGQKLTP